MAYGEHLAINLYYNAFCRHQVLKVDSEVQLAMFAKTQVRYLLYITLYDGNECLLSKAITSPDK